MKWLHNTGIRQSQKIAKGIHAWLNVEVKYFGAVFMQLARYTMRYQESNSLLGLCSFFTSAYNLNLLTVLPYSILTLILN